MRYRARRVVVKARVVKLRGVESQAIAAHLRYLQRDGVTTDGQHGQAYSGEDDRADTRGLCRSRAGGPPPVPVHRGGRGRRRARRTSSPSPAS